VDDLVLFGAGTDGSGAWWDSCPPAKGIMLRWLQSPGLGFPEHGYDLERAPVPDASALDWLRHVAEITGQLSFAFNGGEAVLSSDQPMAFTPAGALAVPAGGLVSVRFGGPAWWVIVRADASSGPLTVQGVAGGQVRVSRHIAGGAGLEWRTRGLEEIRVRGVGALAGVQYQLLDVSRRWTNVVHRCLPVTDPRYLCAPAGASDEAIAKSRVPGSVDWAARYSPGFAQLDPVLLALATKTTPPDGGPVVAAPSSTARPPTATVDPAGAVHLATLDPHLARAVGLLYDDPVALDGRPYAYRVTGTWNGASRVVALTAAALREAGLAVTVDGKPLRTGLVPGRGAALAGRQLDIDASGARRSIPALMVVLSQTAPLDWELTDTAGVVERGTWARGKLTRREVRPSSGLPVAHLRVTGAFTLTGLEVEGPPVMRSATLPYVVAAAGTPPLAPGWLTVDVGTPGGGGTPPRAALRWDTVAGVDPFSGGTVFYQTAATQLGGSPDVPAPAVPPFSPTMLLNDGSPIVVSPDAVDGTGPMAIDRPLSEGWRAWWVRGVDLFGRASAPTAPSVRAIADTALPPPPSIMAAEYVQAGLDPQLALLLGRSAAGDAWLAASPGVSAAIVTFAWTPEQDEQCADVDAFGVYARTPGADGSWDGRAWGAAIAGLGPVQVRLAGQVTSVGADLAMLTITGVEAAGDTESRCVTDLAVDVAGALIGTELVVGATTYPVTGSAEGGAAILVVSHPTGVPPHAGTAALRAAATPIRQVATTVSAPALTAGERVAGVLLTAGGPLLVLATGGGTFLAASASTVPSWPAAGDALTWYPAYRVAVADTGFGPRASSGTPDAHAQLAVTSVRRSTVRPAESSPSAPATVHAVDVTPPQPPTIPDIPSGEHCAQLASAADWHGLSRFTLTWNAVAGATGYQVHRALDDAVRQADMALCGVGAGSTAHSFPAASLPTDPGRRAAVLADLSTVDAALLGGVDATIRAAYTAMRADAWQLIASQAGVASAFMALNGVPFAATVTSYEDRFDGVADAHRFYRVTSRNANGLASALSAATPPICAPRTTPPLPPRGLLALAGEAAVTLRFAGSPSPAIARYRVLRTHDRALAVDVRDMVEQARLAPTPTSTPGAGESAPTASGSALAWTDTAAAPGHEWFYRVVAEDVWGNRSEPSAVLGARSLIPVPEPPTWLPPVRAADTVVLTWTHPEPRLACLVERRRGGSGDPWRAITRDWLPRSVYTVTDSPPHAEQSFDYRVRVRNAADQACPTLPVVTVPGVV
jgi:hypothetical protein